MAQQDPDRTPSAELREQEAGDMFPAESTKTFKRPSKDSHRSSAAFSPRGVEIIGSVTRRPSSRLSMLSNLEMIKTSLLGFFEMADKDKDGVLKQDEFFDLMTHLMPECSSQDISDIFVKLDKGRNGTLNYKELFESSDGTEFLKEVVGLRGQGIASPRGNSKDLDGFPRFSSRGSSRKGSREHVHQHNHGHGTHAHGDAHGHNHDHGGHHPELAETSSLGSRASQTGMRVCFDAQHWKDVEIIEEQKETIQLLEKQLDDLLKLEDEMAALRSELDFETTEKNRLQMEVDTLSTQSKEMTAERHHFEDQLMQLRTENSTLRHDLHAALETRETVTHKVVQQQDNAEMEILRQRADSLEKELTTLTAQVRDYQRENRTQEAIVRTLTEKNAKLTMESETQRRTISELEEDVQQTVEHSQLLSIELVNTSKQLHQRMQSGAAWREQAQDLESQVETLEEQTGARQETQPPLRMMKTDSAALKHGAGDSPSSRRRWSKEKSIRVDMAVKRISEEKNINAKAIQEALKTPAPRRESMEIGVDGDDDELDGHGPPDLLYQISRVDDPVDDEFADPDDDGIPDVDELLEQKIDEITQEYEERIDALMKQIEEDAKQREQWQQEMREQLREELRNEGNGQRRRASKGSLSEPLLPKKKKSNQSRFGCMLCGFKIW